jgi:hypothetical protein
MSISVVEAARVTVNKHRPAQFFGIIPTYAGFMVSRDQLHIFGVLTQIHSYTSSTLICALVQSKHLSPHRRRWHEGTYRGMLLVYVSPEICRWFLLDTKC